MTFTQKHTPTNKVEFVAIMAMLMSLVALSIDAILPALSLIGVGLGLEPDATHETQLLLSTIFIGMAFGLMFYGPLSDAYGRKKTIYLGMFIFLLGSITSLLAIDFNTMLIGRLIQGFGAASCRVVSMALIRDKFEGQEMAKIMSLISAIFIVVPALAPSLGQLILFIANWQAIFIFVMVVSLLGVFLLHIRIPETLKVESRIQFSVKIIYQGIVETVTTPTTLAYMMASALVFGSFIGYLATSQPLLQVEYQLGDSFAFVFGLLSLAVGLSSLLNAKLLSKFSMEQLCISSLTVLIITSGIFFTYSQSIESNPSFYSALAYLGIVFFCFGILFGNFNALAMKPLGHIAGTASSTISSIQTLISTSIGIAIGNMYDGSIVPLASSFLIVATLSLIICLSIKFSSVSNAKFNH